jgi:hypothetical protein
MIGRCAPKTEGLARAGLPERDEPHQLAGLLGSCELGLGIAQATALLLQGEERQHAGARFVAPRQVVALQRLGFAAERDGVKSPHA